MAPVTTYNKAAEEVAGAAKTTHGTFGLTGVYASGGVALTPRQFGLQQIHQLAVYPSRGYVFEVDHAALKLKAYYQDADSVTDSALVQVPNNTNLVALTEVRWKATVI
jgi:hypothetical protein